MLEKREERGKLVMLWVGRSASDKKCVQGREEGDVEMYLGWLGSFSVSMNR